MRLEILSKQLEHSHLIQICVKPYAFPFHVHTILKGT